METFTGQEGRKTEDTKRSSVPQDSSPKQESRASKLIREIFESGRPLTYIRTAEEQRVVGILLEVGRRLDASAPVPVWTWTLTEGLRRGDEASEPDSQGPRAALDFIAAHPHPAIFHLKDFHEPLKEAPEIRRRLRDVYQSCLDSRKYVVITSPVRFIPEEVERSMMFVELRPPDMVELVEFVRESGGAGEDVLYQLARALQGLNIDEARYAMRRALVKSPVLGPESLPFLLEEKRLLVNRSGTIEFIS